MSALASELPFWHFDEDLMVYSDGSIGGGFKLKGFDISCVTAEEINGFSENLEDLLTSCGDGLKLQVFYKLSPNLKKIIDEHEEVSKDSPEVYRPVVDARLKLLRENLEVKKYFLPEIYFFVRSKPFAYKKQKLFDNNKKFRKLNLDDYSDFKEKFLRSLRATESSLHSLKLEPELLSADKWYELCFSYLNLERSEKFKVPVLKKMDDLFSESLSSQLVMTDLLSNKEGIELGKYRFKTITLKSLPEGQSFASMIDSFTKLPFHFWLSQNIHILDQAKEKTKASASKKNCALYGGWQ